MHQGSIFNAVPIKFNLGDNNTAWSGPLFFNSASLSQWIGTELLITLLHNNTEQKKNNEAGETPLSSLPSLSGCHSPSALPEEKDTWGDNSPHSTSKISIRVSFRP